MVWGYERIFADKIFFQALVKRGNSGQKVLHKTQIFLIDYIQINRIKFKRIKIDSLFRDKTFWLNKDR